MNLTIDTPIFRHPLREDVFFVVEGDKKSVLFNGTMFTITKAYQRVSRAALAVSCRKGSIVVVSDSGESITIDDDTFRNTFFAGLSVEEQWLKERYYCPYCSSCAVNGPSDDMDTPDLCEDTTQFNQAYSCRSCGATWVEKYSIKFEGVE